MSGEVRRTTGGIYEVGPVTVILQSPTELLADHNAVLHQLLPLVLHLLGPLAHVVLRVEGESDDTQGAA